jgi:putative addiction module component (TIGR02574 family)
MNKMLGFAAQHLKKETPRHSEKNLLQSNDTSKIEVITMTTLLKEIQQLDIAERIQLVADLWDSVATRTSNFPITDAQKVELDRRLAKRAPEKPGGVNLDQIAQKLGVMI